MLKSPTLENRSGRKRFGHQTGTVTRRLHDAAAEQLICVVSSGITDGVLRASDEIRESVLKSCVRSLEIALNEKTRNRDTNARVTTRMRLLEVVLTHTRLPSLKQCSEIIRLGMRGLFHVAVTVRTYSYTHFLLSQTLNTHPHIKRYEPVPQPCSHVSRSPRTFGSWTRNNTRNNKVMFL